MNELVDMIQNALADKKVFLINYDHRANMIDYHPEFKDLELYEKQAIGYLAKELNKYYELKKK